MELQSSMHSVAVQRPNMVSLNKACQWIGHQRIKVEVLQTVLSAVNCGVGMFNELVLENNICLFCHKIQTKFFHKREGLMQLCTRCDVETCFIFVDVDY